jgi:membrane fusion protein, multidrug efflux system
VPEDAIQHGPKGLYAFVVDDAHKAHVRPVKVGHADAGRVRVTDGLAAGDTVIVQGHYRVQEGTLVTDPRTGDPTNRTAQADTAHGTR